MFIEICVKFLRPTVQQTETGLSWWGRPHPLLLETHSIPAGEEKKNLTPAAPLLPSFHLARRRRPWSPSRSPLPPGLSHSPSPLRRSTAGAVPPSSPSPPPSVRAHLTPRVSHFSHRTRSISRTHLSQAKTMARRLRTAPGASPPASRRTGSPSRRSPRYGRWAVVVDLNPRLLCSDPMRPGPIRSASCRFWTFPHAKIVLL